MRLRSAVVLAGLLLLSACDVDSRYEVFLSDLIDSLNRPQPPVFVNSTFRVEMSSSQKCNDLKDRLIQILSSYYRDVGEAKCIRENMNDFLAFVAKSPILPYTDGNLKFTGGIVSGLAVSRNEAGEVVLYAVIDRARQRTLEAELAQVFSQSVDIKINSVLIDLNNDSRTDYLIDGPSMFVNGEPVVDYSAKVSRRDKVTLALSDVARSKLSKDGSWPIITISEAKQ